MVQELLLHLSHKMTNQENLISIVLKAKCTVGKWASALVNKEKYGGDIVCCERNMLLLSEWISIAEFYNCQNFGDNGSITPDIECLTLAQINELLAKMTAIMKCSC